jgi:hypothetical protein
LHRGDGEQLGVAIPGDDDGLIAAAKRLALGDADADDEPGAAVLERGLAEGGAGRACPDDADLADEIGVSAGDVGREEGRERPDGERCEGDGEQRRPQQEGRLGEPEREARGKGEQGFHGQHAEQPGEDDDEADDDRERHGAQVQRRDERGEGTLAVRPVACVAVVARAAVCAVCAACICAACTASVCAAVDVDAAMDVDPTGDVDAAVIDPDPVGPLAAAEQVDVCCAQHDEGPVQQHDAEQHRVDHGREREGDGQEGAHDRPRGAAAAGGSSALAAMGGPKVMSAVAMILPSSVRAKMSVNPTLRHVDTNTNASPYVFTLGFLPFSAW